MAHSANYLLLASAFLLGGRPALATEEAAVRSTPAAPTAVVKCLGLSSVPITFDAEQALPLRLVTTVACGSRVSVLDETEGYTARVRTPDGQAGYVARIYLAGRDTQAAEPARVGVPTAIPEHGVVRWQAGAPGCDQFLSQGRRVESLTAEGITVQVSLEDTGWKYRVNVAVFNSGDRPIAVAAGGVSIDELQPQLKPLLPVSPAQLAHTTNHQPSWTRATAAPSPSAVPIAPAGVSSAEQAKFRVTNTPDYLDPHVSALVVHPRAFARSESWDVEAVALKSGALPAGQKTSGLLWFERDPGSQELSLRVPVGDLVFDFPFAFDQKR